MLDASLIRERRLDLNMSKRNLAETADISTTVLRSIEAGWNHHKLELGKVARLAAALSLSIPDLLVDSAATRPQAPSGPETPDDAQQVGTLLLSCPSMIAMDALRESLGWPRSRLDTAMSALNARLLTVGARLHVVRGDVGIQPDLHSDRNALRTLHRHHTARRGLNRSQAVLLHRVVSGSTPNHRHTSRIGPQMTALRNAGLVVTPSGIDPQPSADVRFSLMLDETCSQQSALT